MLLFMYTLYITMFFFNVYLRPNTFIMKEIICNRKETNIRLNNACTWFAPCRKHRMNL